MPFVSASPTIRGAVLARSSSISLLEAFGSTVGPSFLFATGLGFDDDLLRLFLTFGFRQIFQFFGFLGLRFFFARAPRRRVPVLVGELVEQRFQFAVTPWTSADTVIVPVAALGLVGEPARRRRPGPVPRGRRDSRGWRAGRRRRAKGARR